MFPTAFFMTVLVLLSLMLSVFQLPEGATVWLNFWRPQWLLLAFILWVQRVPQYRGNLYHMLFVRNASDDGTTTRRILVAAWLSGFYVDVLLGDPFGLNGVVFAFIAFYLLRYRDRLHLQTLFQQMIMIFMMAFLSELFRAFVLNAVADQPWDLQPLTLAVSSSLFWPIYVWIANRFIGAFRRA